MTSAGQRGSRPDSGPPGFRDRFRGALLGLAAGDALGTTLEFTKRGTFQPIADMVGGGPFRLAPGQWTDDTSMALCLADSLLESNSCDTGDQMRRYLRWRDNGYRSSTGVCFDIGNTVRDALTAFRRTGDPNAGPTAAHTAGNGSLMRLAPVPLFFAAQPRVAIEMAAVSSRTTHGAATAVDACRYFAGLIVGALHGISKDELLAPGYSPVSGLWQEEPLHPGVAAIANGSFRGKSAAEIQTTGYVLHTLEAALWAFSTTDDYASGALAVVNLGGDADTSGAVFGQLAGAYYGADGIPASWRDRVAQASEITMLADRLFEARTGQTDAFDG